MRSVLIRIFDLLFLMAWTGFVFIMVWVFGSLFSTVRAHSLLRILIPDIGTQILFTTAFLWIVLFIVVLTFSYREDRFDKFRNTVWRRLLLIHFLMLTGSTAYYIGYLRRRLALDEHVKDKTTFVVQDRHKLVLNVLYFISFYGTLTVFLLVGIFFALPTGPVGAADFILLRSVFVIIPLVALATAVLNVVLVIHAGNRPQDQWEKSNFIVMLNPWSGVFGMRKYYLKLLRPESHKRGHPLGRKV